MTKYLYYIFDKSEHEINFNLFCYFKKIVVYEDALDLFHRLQYICQ